MPEGIRTTAKKIRNSARHGGAKYANMALPDSLRWVYTLGFKVGFLLLIKSFLVLRFLDLSLTGGLIVTAQAITAVVLIIAGVNLQEGSAIGNVRVSGQYGLMFLATGIASQLICTARDAFKWEFIRQTTESNWFMEMIGKATNMLGNATLSLVFWDLDLWTAFCLLLAGITLVRCYTLARGQQVTEQTD